MSSDNGKTFQMEAVNQMVRLTVHLDRRRGREKDGEEKREGGREGNIHISKKPNDIATYTCRMKADTKYSYDWGFQLID